MTPADKLRQKAKELRARPHLLFPASSEREAVLLDLLADAWEAMQYGMPTDPRGDPHDYDCMGQHGYRCKCGVPALRRRIEKIAS